MRHFGNITTPIKIANWEHKPILISLRNLSKSQIIDYPNKSKVCGKIGICFGYLQDQMSTIARNEPALLLVPSLPACPYQLWGELKVDGYR